MLCEKVWQYEFEPRSKFVDAYVSRLRRRISDQAGDDPIVTVRGLGYMIRA
jgi:two-component system OmpR family response regulator